jgi:hypothetical protein
MTRFYGNMHDGGGYLPPDLEISAAAAAASSAKGSKDSYTKTIKMPLIRNKEYRFFFTYKYEDPETKEIKESDRSPVWKETFSIPNLTKGVLNLVLTPGYKSYGVKFDIDPTSVQEDVVIFESLSSTSIGNVVYIGTSTNVTIPTSSIATRWVTVRTRDKWEDLNITDTGPLSVTPLNPDPDTSTPPSGMTTTSATAVVDPNDKSGFSAMPTITWAASTDPNTKGYSIRWSTDNPSSVANPMWEYNNVDGINTTTFVVTGLTPNVTYYYEVAPKSAYNAINWSNKTSGTFSATDSTAGGAWSRLKSYLSIGGATEDLFKIGTQIVQKVNNSTTIVPTYTADTTVNNGIILNKSTTNVGNNYWLNSGHFRVGSETAFMYWNGSDLYTTGKINATGGSFTGDVKLDGGTLFAGGAANSGQRVRLNSSGIFAYNAAGAQTFSLDTAGYVNATTGLIGGWNLGSTTLSANNVTLNSAGTISVGSTPSTSVYISSTDDKRIWAGSQSSSAAKFSVDQNGILRAEGAIIGLGAGSTIDGYATTSSLNNYTLTTTTTAINSRLSTVEGAYVTNTTLNTNIATKNAIFVQDGQPTATKIGDVWIDTDEGNILKTWTGTTWTTRTNSTYATTTALNTKLEAGGFAIATASNQITNITSNGIFITPGTFKISNTNETAPSTGSYVLLNSAGLTAYDGTKTTFAISSSGSASFSGNLSAATGSFSGSVTATSGEVGGFVLGNADLTASTSKLPRIIFGDKILVGWISGTDYGLRAGNPRTDSGASFRIYTEDNVNRFTADSASRTYAGEVRNALRASPIRSIGAVVTESSSRRFKENIVVAPKRYYDRILNVDPMFYTYKTDSEEVLPELRGHHRFGMIAEDLEEAGLGYFVERDMHGRPTNLNDMMSFPLLLIPIIKELKQEVKSLQDSIIAMGGTV